MANRLNVSPTQGNLLRLQAELEQIHNGHQLLDRKQEVLVKKLMAMITEVEALKAEARERFRAAHTAIQLARMRLGVERVRQVCQASPAEVSVKVRRRSILGAKVPLVQVKIKPQEPPYGLDDTSPALDEARARWLEVVRLLSRLTETVTTIWRLALELRKTQRRVNALDTIMIPRHQNTVNYIEQALDEENREDIMRAKMVKALHTQNNNSR